MNGELAQRISLVAYGNAFLAGRDHGDVGATTTFRYVHSLEFTFQASRRRRTRSAMTPTSWFEQLASRGVQRLSIDRIGAIERPRGGPLPEHLEVAFVRGEHSAILGQRAKKTELWRASWAIASGERPADNRIWDVRYEGGETATPVALHHPALTDAADQLDRTLTETERFARANDTGHWIEWFGAARRLLSGDEPEIPYHTDLVPKDVSLERRRVLAAAVKGYVFGGMGSWNDLGFGDSATRAEYVDLAERLYQSVMYALDAAVDESDET